MGRARCSTFVAAALVLVGSAVPAGAQEAPGACKAGQSDRQERPTPERLLPKVGQAFGVDPAHLRGASYVRCARGRLMACEVGANLDCGQANVSRRSVGGDAFCHDSPGADVVPLAATGHDTVFDWHCKGTRAVAGRQLATVDAFGFLRGNWRVVP